VSVGYPTSLFPASVSWEYHESLSGRWAISYFLPPSRKSTRQAENKFHDYHDGLPQRKKLGLGEKSRKVKRKRFMGLKDECKKLPKPVTEVVNDAVQTLKHDAQDAVSQETHQAEARN
jgi:hypothetical protein